MKPRRIGILFIVLICSALVIPAFAATVRKSDNAKDRYLRYSRQSTRNFMGQRNLVPDFANNPQGFGVELTIEKKSDGKGWQPVQQNHVFSNKDLIRFRFKANGSSYVTLLNNGKMIWPPPGGRNLIPDSEFQSSGATDIEIGPFRVTPPATVEKNVLIISPVPFSQQAHVLESIPNNASGAAAAAPPQASTSLQSVEAEDIASIEAQLRSVRNASRNLVYETENNTTYVVSDESDSVKPLRYAFDLNHK